MPLATQITGLATGVGNYLRDSIRPRLLPAGGATGQVLRKTTAGDYAAGWAGERASGRNRIRNGDFTVNQRAVSGTVVLAAGEYGHDGWKGGAGGCTYSFFMVGSAMVLAITAGTLLQVIEGGRYVQEGGSYTLSWSGNATGRIYQGSGSGVVYGSSPVTANSFTAATNAIVEFATGSLYLVQAEPGIAATSFEYRDDELRRCQRYYQRYNYVANKPLIDLTTTSVINLTHWIDSPEMRANPTLSQTGITANTGAAIGLSGGGSTGISLVITTNAMGRHFLQASSSGGYVEAKAEL